MYLQDLQLDRYRNITQADLHFHPQFNLIVGENGQGKTNLLSAIYWLSTLTPLPSQQVRELIQWGERETFVQGKIFLQGLVHRLGVSYDKHKRIAYREEKRCKSQNYFGALSVVSFTPQDLTIVKGSPESRRRFIDRGIFTEQSNHLDTVLRFQRALDRRNQLLREGGDARLLSAYEATLAESGAWLMLSRARYTQTLSPRFTNTLREVSHFEGTLTYKPGIQTSPPLEVGLEVLQAELMRYWESHRQSDRNRGFTQRGPQVDDFSLRLADRSAKSYASQGQQRAMVLALKIAQIEGLSEHIQSRPVLLLDDVSSELDPMRATLLFNYLNRFDGQVFLTTTHERHIPIPIEAEKSVWRVQAGHITGDKI